MDEYIRVCAYYKWLKNPYVSATHNWLEAEEEIKKSIVNIDFLKSGQHLSEANKQEIELVIEVKHKNKQAKLDDFYNKTLEAHKKY